MVKKPEYIKLVKADIPLRLKTEIWHVVSVSSENVLGTIRWYSRWRQYVFEPSAGTIFNPACLDQISGWVKEKTREHRRMTQEQ